MRRTELLRRVGTELPCLLCPLPPQELAKRRLNDAAFALPVLASAVWSSPALTEIDRKRLNDLLASLVRCSANGEDLMWSVERLSSDILNLAAASPELEAECREFLESLSSPTN